VKFCEILWLNYRTIKIIGGFDMKHIYGPVPSRRLGFSLGLDLVPYKICSFDCVYCQLGKTTLKTVVRKIHVPYRKIIDELKDVLKQKKKIDYITISGSGEPTLNLDIGKLIYEIKKLTSKKFFLCL